MVTTDVHETGYEWEYARKDDDRTTIQKVAHFIYNPATHAILGRTVTSWSALLLFYVIFYFVLGLLFHISIKILMSTLTEDYPKWQLQDSFITTNPGLGYRPMANQTEESAIMWISNRTKQSLVLSMNDFLKEHYTADKDATPILCNSTRKPDYEKKEYCRVDVNEESYKSCTAKTGYGFWIDEPCIFVKLNRIYKWKPKSYNSNESLPKDIPSHTRPAIVEAMERDPDQVWVSCDGRSARDKENRGEIAYYPAPGFPNYFYPYLNTKGYMSPLVAVQFKNLKPNVPITIECRAWAKNIYYRGNAQQREGSTQFIVMVDQN